ncbi:MAG: hypothetical protein GY765_18835 [bacterium]|nr:hypothetical protein [bacterium]
MVSGKNELCKACGVQLFPDSNFCHKCGVSIATGTPPAGLLGNVELQEDSPFSHLPKLYLLSSSVNNFRYRGTSYDNVKINWFVFGREKPHVPFDVAIENYLKLSPAARIHPENFLRERFTLDEARMLKAYLETAQKIKSTIDEVLLPVPDLEKGNHDFPPLPGTDFIQLYSKTDYNLSFKAEGVFNLKLADARIVPDDRITVISKNIAGDLAKYSEKRKKETPG